MTGILPDTQNFPRTRKLMIVALARKLIIVLWHYVNTGVVPAGFKLHPAD
jgi:hypothetical protein